jgi:hypothetical protein
MHIQSSYLTLKVDLFSLALSFERGLATGDSNSASENLRRFFEQRFHEGSDSLVSLLLILPPMSSNLSMKWYAATCALEPLAHALPSTRTHSSSQGRVMTNHLFLPLDS